MVSVVYGTSKKLDHMRPGEISITRAQNPAAFALAGLAYDTKFDLGAMLDLPWNDRYFKVPPRSPHGNSPKLGTLHATVMKSFALAYKAAQSR